MRRFVLAVLLLTAFGIIPANAAHTKVSLVLAAQSVHPGETIMAGVRLQMESHWHTYWRNPGGAGIATKIEWKLPPGITAGEIQWPIPEKLVADDLTTYDYSDEVVLLVPLTVAPNAPPGSVELKGTVKWLECDTSCIPGKGEVQAMLSVGTETKPSADATLIEAWQKKLPKIAGNDFAVKASWEGPAEKDVRPLLLEWTSAGAPADADFFPYASDNFEVGWKTEPIPGGEGRIKLRKRIKKFDGDWPAKISGLLIQHSGVSVVGYQVSVPLENASAAPVTDPLAFDAPNSAHTQVRLILAAQTARPGATIMAGLQLQMEPHWHTYWRNPGGPGLATKIDWHLPAGISAGEIQWPVPEKVLAEDLTTYNYSGEVTLLVPIIVASNALAGPLELKGTVSWLECNTMCIQREGAVEASLTIGAEIKASADAGLIDAAKEKLPQTGGAIAATASWEGPANGNNRALILEWNGSGPPSEAEFFPYQAEHFQVGWKTEPLTASAGKIRVRKTIIKTEGEWPQKVAGVLAQHSGDTVIGYEVNLAIEPAGSNALAQTPNGPRINSLLEMLLYAFLGGLILNIMPCVLPVIALKILGFVNHGRSSPGQVRKLGLIYAMGVLTSFLALAALVIAVKQAGHRAGWGMQFSSPEFLVVLTVLVTLVALNLFGLFEVNLSGKVLGAAGNLSAKEGNAGAFFNGVLATILATPCTAPFLGVALGFAFAQSYPIIVLIFLTAGLGLAFPYVVLSWNPAWLKLLPKPGAWMEKFKIAMGFPMLATAFWLFQLTPTYYGKRVIWLGLFLVIVGLAAWIYGEFVQRGRTRKSLALALFALLLVGGYGYLVEGQLQWRKPMLDAGASPTQKVDASGIDWQPWSPQALAKARTLGRPILVDFTADWCQTCNWNLAHSIDVKAVRAKIKEINAIAFVADNTTFPDNIADELARYQRAGVPLVLVYPRDPNLPPQVLPDGVLTQGIVLDALTAAARTGPTTALASPTR